MRLHMLISVFQISQTNRILKCDFALKLCFWENLQNKPLYLKIQFLNFSDAIFHRSRLCRGPHSENVKLALSLVVWWNFACPLILTKSSPRDYKISLSLGRGFADVQIVKTWKLPVLLLNHKECLNTKFAHTLILTRPNRRDFQMPCVVEALPRSKFWKCEIGPIFRIVWNILTKSHTQWHCQALAQAVPFSISRCFAEV